MTESFTKKRSPGLIIDPSRPYLPKEILMSIEEIEEKIEAGLLSPEFVEFHKKLTLEYNLSIKESKKKVEKKIEKKVEKNIEKKTEEKVSFYSGDKNKKENGSEKVAEKAAEVTDESNENFFECECKLKHFYPSTRCNICGYEIKWEEYE